jgi:hypothetical protein
VKFLLHKTGKIHFIGVWVGDCSDRVPVGSTRDKLEHRKFVTAVDVGIEHDLPFVAGEVFQNFVFIICHFFGICVLQDGPFPSCEGRLRLRNEYSA